ncbi:hypothetical protein W03_18490 [Nitrosomonas sp. PY1]|uniref:hypothetical protein n=1 Tax=Nitrosomonas sp. PY1 TaxID=1803906 RepID=UPI001FC81D46|nr:hypothetical protein [Nitrosomonas sp. PY1]GKS69845.1 hypothetical protein W03_18490 [Nitrosomonas sp. PY1]
MSSGSDDFNDDSPQSGSHKQFKFTINNGMVTQVFEFKDGSYQSKSIDADDIYTVDANGVVEHREPKPFGTEITRYADTDGSGVYNRISEQWIGDGFELKDDLKYLPTDGDDFIAVRGGEDCHGGRGSDDFVIREASHLRIGDFFSDDDTLVFDTGLGLTSKDHLASFIHEIRQEGDNFIVDFGPGISITLVGVHPDQISWDDVSVLS